MNEKKLEMTSVDYFNYLINLQKECSPELIIKCIEKNEKLYINPDDIPYLKDIILLFLFKKCILRRQDIEKIKSLFHSYEKDLEDYSIDEEFIISLETLNNSEIFQNLVKHWKYSDKICYLNYIYLENNVNKKLVHCFNYESFLTIQKEQYFGDFGLDSVSRKRFKRNFN